MARPKHNFNKRTRQASASKSRAMPFGVDLKSLNLFYESMAMMMRSGVPLNVALEKFRAHRSLGDSVGRISDAIKGGASLSDAVARETGVFKEIDAVRIAQAEATGTLDRVFRELHDQVVHLAAYRASTLKMLALPVLYAFAGLAALRLPGLVGGDTSAISYGLPLGVLLVLVVVVVVLAQRSQPLRWVPGHEAICESLAKLPLLCSVLRGQARYGFADSMFLTFHSGMSLTTGIPLGLRRIPVPTWRRQMTVAMERAADGAGFAETLAATRFFDERDNVRITSGEIAGKLDEAFAAIAHESRLAVQTSLRRIARVFASVIGVIVLTAIGYAIITGFTDRLNIIDELSSFRVRTQDRVRWW